MNFQNSAKRYKAPPLSPDNYWEGHAARAVGEPKRLRLLGRGWIMTQADSLNSTSIINAMERGQSYASIGVALKDLTFQINKLSVDVKKKENINYKISFIGCKKGKTEPEKFMFVQADKASF